MWQYFWPHAVYHLTRWFPRNNRLKIRIVVMILTLAVLAPQIYVLALPQTARFCGQHLFELLIVGIVFSFAMIGFTFLFSLMDPVPWEVKLAFHIFGGICFITGIIVTAFTSLAQDCKNNTEGLYYYSIAITVLSMVCTVFFIITVPFWLINRLRRNAVLDWKERDGICYEPVKCCSCIWHV